MAQQTTRCRLTLIVRSAALVAMAWPLAGQALAQDSGLGPTDQKAMANLQGMADYLSRETNVSFRARPFFDVVQPSGTKVKMARQVDVMLQRPDHLAAHTVDEAGIAGSIWYDGAKLTVWRRTSNEFMALELAGGIDTLLDELINKYEFQVPLADLLYSDVSKALGETIISSEYIGLRTVDGVQCHHLSFESVGADWQIWIEADSTSIPRRFVIDYATDENQPQFMPQLDAWSLGGEIEDFRFMAVMPEGVEQVEFRKFAADGEVEQ